MWWVRVHCESNNTEVIMDFPLKCGALGAYVVLLIMDKVVVLLMPMCIVRHSVFYARHFSQTVNIIAKFRLVTAVRDMKEYSVVSENHFGVAMGLRPSWSYELVTLNALIYIPHRVTYCFRGRGDEFTTIMH